MTTKPACPVGPLSYYGGKQAQGKAAWIASLLPWSRESTYCEPFGGMMSVLLHRQPVRTEIYNDLDGNVVNGGGRSAPIVRNLAKWWRQCRTAVRSLNGRLRSLTTRPTQA